ncbi:Wdr35 [Scenedesmus sp. PABB004]|nr:Wdr35 [Scenedesmus sp. PABB004]
MAGDYSLWLRPAGPTAAKLRAEIERQAAEQGAPRFEPHVTLLPDIAGEREALVAAAKDLAAGIKRFRVNFLNVSQGSTFHRCVYLLVAKEEGIMAAGAAARRTLGAPPGDDFMPHLSLLYAEPTPEARSAAVVAAIGRLYGEAASYDGLLVDAGYAAESLSLWFTPAADRSLASWEQVAEFPLAPAERASTMFAYLSKKIALPGAPKLRCIAWNSEQGWIACGGEGALLKARAGAARACGRRGRGARDRRRARAPQVLRLEAAPAAAGGGGAPAAAAPAGGGGGALALNQSLEGHSGAVVCAAWNHAHGKLTTADDAGLIIVWTLFNGGWHEEMVNNRNKGAVRDMRWTPRGDRIAIAYDDGAVIVGAVDGTRLWGKELGMALSLLEWAPDGRFLVFATAGGDVHTYDANGNAVQRVPLLCNEGVVGPCRAVGLEWYDGSRGHAEPGCPVLAVALDNGRMQARAHAGARAGAASPPAGAERRAARVSQLMRHDTDDSPVCVDTGIKPRVIKWNHNGSVRAAPTGAGFRGARRRRTRLTPVPPPPRRAAQVLAVAGHQPTPDGGALWLVQFYSPAGEHLRTLRVPGGGVAGIAWEGSGLRLGLAVDAQLLFASLRPHHLWAYFSDTLVYAFTKRERPEHCVLFWGTRSNERHAKYVRRVSHIAAHGEFCLLASKGEAAGEHVLILCNAIGSPVDSKTIDLEPKHVLLTGAAPLRGAVLRAAHRARGARHELEAAGPRAARAADCYAIAASDEVVYVWHFRNAFTRALVAAEAPAPGAGGVGGGGAGGGGGAASKLQREGRERMFHIDAPGDPQAPELFKAAAQPGACADPIAAVTARAHSLLVARGSGLVHAFGVPGLAPAGQHLLRCRPARLALNCDGSRLAVVDFGGVLSLMDLAAPGAGKMTGEHLAYERKVRPRRQPRGCSGAGAAPRRAASRRRRRARWVRARARAQDVWDLCWASDNPELLAVAEKGRMLVLRGEAPEEPVPSSAYLAAFSDLQARVGRRRRCEAVTARAVAGRAAAAAALLPRRCRPALQVRGVLLDDIMQHPDLPELGMVADLETRSLRDTRALLAAGAEADAHEFIAANPHARLWTLLAEHALERLDLHTAERAFVRARDFQGAALARHVAGLGDRAKQAAEVHVYFKRFEEAEDLYRAMDRLDLAIGLRGRLGDWFKVEALIKESGGNDAALAGAWDRIGHYYSDRQRWAKAATYYTQSRNTPMLAACLYQLEDFDGLLKLVEVLPEGQPLLADIGAKLQSVGLCAEAVAAFLKAGDAKAAVDACVLLHQWDQALALAQAHNYPQAEGLLQQYAGHLLKKKRHLEAAELYRKARCAAAPGWLAGWRGASAAPTCCTAANAEGPPHARAAQAQRHTEAAKLLVDMAQQLASQRAPPLAIKKLYVLAALEVEAFKCKALAGAGGDGASAAATLLGAPGATTRGGPPGATTRGGPPGAPTRGGHAVATAGAAPPATATAAAAHTLAGLMTLEAAAAGGEMRGLDGAWRGAEAYHFWLLAHRQLYDGQVDAALRTALRLRAYDDLLGAADVWAFLALVGFYARFYGTCSKAFVKLESLPGLPREAREAYADLAMSIFTAHPPADPASLAEGRDAGGGAAAGREARAQHEGLLDDLASDKDQVCVASGKAVRDAPAVRCRTCKHAAIVTELAGQRACPLCHSALPEGAAGRSGGRGPKQRGQASPGPPASRDDLPGPPSPAFGPAPEAAAAKESPLPAAAASPAQRPRRPPSALSVSGAPAAMPPLTLTVLAGPAAGAVLSKDVSKLSLGRVKTGNALALKDDMVSSRHVQLEWREDAWYALDLESSNGTKLNDAERSMLEGQTYKLRSGDLLRLGPQTVVQLQYMEPGDDTLTVADKLTADAERLAASIKAAAAASVHQIRRGLGARAAARPFAMDNLLGQISSKLAGKPSKASIHVVVDPKQPAFAIPASRKATPSPKQEHSATEEEDQLQVCEREDSESYAKRTITEIETCLGFAFHAAPGEEDPETISSRELETLNTQVEAALQSGLNFKDRFRTNSRKRLLPHAEQEQEGQLGGALPEEGEDAAAADEQGAAADAAAAQAAEQQQRQQPPAQPPGGRRRAPPAPALGGLKLAVGSQMETGEWRTNGVWVRKDKAEGEGVPTNLQVKELGRGCFGSVWLAKWRGVEVALKELLNPGGANDTAAVEVFAEAEKLASLRHPCVMGFYGVVTDGSGGGGTVAEYVCHGSLRSGLAKIKKKARRRGPGGGGRGEGGGAQGAARGRTGGEALRAAPPVVAGGGRGPAPVHFDLKCDNLLCDLRDLNKPVVKIGDLGLSKTKKGSFISGNMRGTLPWMAPELFPSVPGAASGVAAARKDPEDRVDVFSFGVVLWEIWTLGEQPYPNLSLQEIFAGVMTGTLRPALPPGCDPAWASLMQDCWHAVPRMRPSFTDIIARLEAMLQRWSAHAPPAPPAAGGGGGAVGAGGGGGAAGGAHHGPGGTPRGAA